MFIVCCFTFFFSFLTWFGLLHSFFYQPMKHLSLAEQHSKLSDFSLVVGTSMRVAPASELPFNTVQSRASTKEQESKEDQEQPQQFCCIVNMMDTPKDHLASVRCYGKSDVFFYHLMKAMDLKVDVPPSWNEQIFTATQMKKKAAQYVPVHTANHYVGKATREREMAVALFQVEEELILGKEDE